MFLQLLNTERLTIFAANIQVCFLLFESLRSNLKFQLEYYLTKISEIIVSENIRILYETRELALDNLLQLWRIPGFAAELYINYDCDLYCTNLFEDLTKLLSKNTLSAIHGQNILSLDTLLTVVDSIEKNCSKSKNGDPVNYTSEFFFVFITEVILVGVDGMTFSVDIFFCCYSMFKIPDYYWSQTGRKR